MGTGFTFVSLNLACYQNVKCFDGNMRCCIKKNGTYEYVTKGPNGPSHQKRSERRSARAFENQNQCSLRSLAHRSLGQPTPQSSTIHAECVTPLTRGRPHCFLLFFLTPSIFLFFPILTETVPKPITTFVLQYSSINNQLSNTNKSK